VSLPGGDLHVGTRRVELRPEAELGSLEELRETPIVLPSGAAVPLRRIAEVRRTPEEPRRELARVDGEAAVVLGVVPRFRIEAVSFGREVRSLLDAFDAERDDVELTLIAFQPDKVEGRLGELGFSLLLGIGIVAGVLLLTMGPRLGLVVSSVVPLVTFASVAIYAVGGGVLHQMAVAALVISLGLLVDNAIVMAEAIQRRLDEGEPRGEAIGSTVRELAVPLASSTGTTLASFVPMLLAPGTTGDFTRAIPVVVMLTLCASLVYALVVTPVLSGLILRPSRGGSEGTVERLARTIGRFSVRRPLLTLLAVTLAVGASASFAPAVKKNFFPSSDREQLVVSVELPEGTHLDATDDVARRLEAALRARPEVRQLAAFVGRTTPSFYYNLPRQPQAPHLAQLVVTTGGAAEVGPVMDFVRAYAARTLPEAVVVANRLEQGPPIPAPVQVRLLGDDLSALHLASEEVRRALRAVEGTRDIRTDHGPGAPLLAYRIDDAAAARRGMARGQVALAMLGRTRGLPVGTYRAEDDPLPIRLRAPLADDQTPEGLEGAELVAEDGRRASVGALTTRSLRYAPAVIHHFDRARTVSVLSDVEEGETYQAIVAELTPMLDAIEWPDGVRWEFGGAIESSAEANANLGANGPLGALLLVSILLAQFNSLRRVGIVLFTAPLAVMGIWPGLLLFDLPFGFVALLGAIALIGIVVNGAIVLIDLADLQRAAGATVAEALEVAVTRRTRPILLTTITTIAGLMPLLFSASTLWPPLAAAMISGLSVATVLTLFAVPALYRLLFRDPETPAAAPEGAAS
jgi:multidrug efflux pump subunit AcrB